MSYYKWLGAAGAEIIGKNMAVHSPNPMVPVKK